MALSKQQKEDREPWKTHLCLWERDLLHLAGEFEGWLDIAVDLGFSVEKIMKPWTFADAGRRVKIMTWDEYHRQIEYHRQMAQSTRIKSASVRDSSTCS